VWNRYGHHEAIEVLLQLRAQIDVTNSNGDTPLHCAAKTFGEFDAIRVLLDYGADCTIQNVRPPTQIQFNALVSLIAHRERTAQRPHASRVLSHTHGIQSHSRQRRCTTESLDRCHCASCFECDCVVGAGRAT